MSIVNDYKNNLLRLRNLHGVRLTFNLELCNFSLTTELSSHANDIETTESISLVDADCISKFHVLFSVHLNQSRTATLRNSPIKIYKRHEETNRKIAIESSTSPSHSFLFLSTFHCPTSRYSVIKN